MIVSKLRCAVLEGQCHGVYDEAVDATADTVTGSSNLPRLSTPKSFFVATSSAITLTSSTVGTTASAERYGGELTISVSMNS
jgi:hypothetical protein